MKTNQEAFTKIVLHLREQGVKSEFESCGESTCLYRGPNGLKCAIGCLIDDEHYFSGLESLGPEEPDVTDAIAWSGWDMVDLMMLTELQRIHDSNDPCAWESKLTDLAIDYELEMPPKDNK